MGNDARSGNYSAGERAHLDKGKSGSTLPTALFAERNDGTGLGAHAFLSGSSQAIPKVYCRRTERVLRNKSETGK